jgi:hypothetical protein
VKYYDFDVPIHPKNLAIILHPHWGYLCKFGEKGFTFDELVDFYKFEFVSSNLRNNGRVNYIIYYIFNNF